MRIALVDDIKIKADPAHLGALAGVDLDPWQRDVMSFRASRLLLNCHRQSGKSTVVALKAIWSALYEKSLVLLLSPSLRQSRELFKKVDDVYEALGRPVPAKVNNQLELELSTGGRIVSLPSAEATIRGFSGPRLIIMDEASRIPSALFEAIIPMQSVSGGTLILLSSPWGKRGFFYEAWAGMKGPWKRIQRTADQCSRITPLRLAEARLLMDEPKFDREYLCKFTESGGQYFSEESLERAFRLGNYQTEDGDPYGSLADLFDDSPLSPEGVAASNRPHTTHARRSRQSTNDPTNADDPAGDRSPADGLDVTEFDDECSAAEAAHLLADLGGGL